MSEEPDKREHSTKPEVDDLTDYQSLNSLGGAGVAGTAKETPAQETSAQETTATETPASDAQKDQANTKVMKYNGDYNDGSDFSAVDNEGETNA